MAYVRLQLSNIALVRSLSAKSVSCNCEFLKTVFLILVLKNEEWFSWQPSNEKESPNSLQVSNRSPNILQSLNFMSRKAVLFSFAKLKLQPLNVQSVNLNSERSLSEKLQLLKMQFSYSPFVSVSFRSKVLSCMYVSSICLFCHLERCLVTLATNGSRLCEVADFQHKCSFEKLNLNLAINCHRGTAPAILQNRCYAFALLFLLFVLLSFCVGFVASWHGGSFAIFGLCVGLCELQMCHQTVMAVNILICLLLLGHPFVLRQANILLQVV